VTKIYRSVYALIAWSALVAQLVIVLSRPENTSTLAAGANFFSFFTIQTNLLAAVVMSFSVISPNGWADAARLRGAIAVYIALVALVYHAVLAQLLDLQGLDALIDETLHTVLPIMFVVDWIFFADKSGLRARHAATWLIFPLVFCAYSLIRGAIIGWYPYPFLDPVASGGYGMVLINVLLLLVIFYLGGLLIVWLRRLPGLGSQRAGRS